MKLLIDCVSKNLNILLINDRSEITDFLNKKLNNNIIDIFIEQIKKFLKKNKIEITQIKELYIVNGPGSFTSLKMISVFSNLWKTINNLKIYEIDFGQWNSLKDNELLWWKEKNNCFYFWNSHNKSTKICNDITLQKIINNTKIEIKELIQKNNYTDKWDYNKNNFIETKFFKPKYVKRHLWTK